MKLRPIRPTATIKRRKPPVRLKASVSRAASRRQVEEYTDDEDYYEVSEPNMKLSHAFIVVLILHLVAVAGVFGFNSMKNRQNALARIAAEAVVAETAVPAAAANSPATAVENTVPTSVAPAPGKPSALPEQNVSSRMYEVVPGDTLTRIAGKHGTTIEAIENANGLTSDSVLRVGQSLQIPAQSESATKSVSASAPLAPVPAPVAASQTSEPAPAAVVPNSAATSAAGEEMIVYEVVAGDNPYSIAKRHEISYQKLLDVNGITDPTKLQIGQKLKIPQSR